MTSSSFELSFWATLLSLQAFLLNYPTELFLLSYPFYLSYWANPWAIPQTNVLLTPPPTLTTTTTTTRPSALLEPRFAAKKWASSRPCGFPLLLCSRAFLLTLLVVVLHFEEKLKHSSGRKTYSLNFCTHEFAWGPKTPTHGFSYYIFCTVRRKRESLSSKD